MIASLPVLWAVRPVYTLTPTGWHVLPTMNWLGGVLFFTVESAALGLLVYGLTRLAQLAVQLEDLRKTLPKAFIAR